MMEPAKTINGGMRCSLLSDLPPTDETSSSFLEVTPDAVTAKMVDRRLSRTRLSAA